jgi:deazaflavin-dependent oxidoreductase (nitroreductase family)
MHAASDVAGDRERWGRLRLMRARRRWHRRAAKGNGGRLMGRMGSALILLLTTTGRRSQRERTVPVLYLEDGGRFVMVASLAGAPRNPAWFLNLEANPRVRLQVRSRRFAATARRGSAEEKEQLWPRLVAMYPAYESYQARTTRDIPVVIATPPIPETIATCVTRWSGPDRLAPALRRVRPLF